MSLFFLIVAVIVFPSSDFHVTTHFEVDDFLVVASYLTSEVATVTSFSFKVVILSIWLFKVGLAFNSEPLTV